MSAETHIFPDKFTPPGSDIYYAVRFAPGVQRQPLSLINALYRSLRDIPLACSDPAVARAKLDWWSEELHYVGRSQARHPITRALTPIYLEQPMIGEHLEQILRASNQEIGGVRLAHRADLETHCVQTGARFTRLLTLVAGGDQAQQHAAEQLGRFLRMVEIIRDLGQDLRRDRYLLPADALAEKGLSYQRLQAESSQVPLRELLREIASDQRRGYLKTLADLQGRHAALGAARSLAAMADSLLREIEKEGFQVLQQRTSLTPLRKLWIGWRSHRRSRAC